MNQSQEQQRRILAAAPATTIPTSEVAAHRRKVALLVKLEMLTPLSDEELAARVKAAFEMLPSVGACEVEALL